MRTSGTFAASRFDLGGSVKLAASKQRDHQRSSEMATDPSEFVSIFSPGGTKLTLPPASPAGSEAGGVGSAQSSQTPAQQGAAGSVVQKILGGPSGSIGSVGSGSDTAGSKTGATEPVTPAARLLRWYSRRRPAIDGAMGFTRPHVKSVRLINGTLGGSVSARVANRGLARPARSLVHRGPGERRVREGAG